MSNNFYYSSFSCLLSSSPIFLLLDSTSTELNYSITVENGLKYLNCYAFYVEDSLQSAEQQAEEFICFLELESVYIFQVSIEKIEFLKSIP